STHRRRSPSTKSAPSASSACPRRRPRVGTPLLDHASSSPQAYFQERPVRVSPLRHGSRRGVPTRRRRSAGARAGSRIASATSAREDALSNRLGEEDVERLNERR